jgi:hypothetical protein
MARYMFFLGGDDAEMRRIAEVLSGACTPWADARLAWGAKASAYGDEVSQAASNGYAPVLVELEVNCKVPKGTIVIDHHGDRAAEPASILQVLSLLGRRPTRWDLVIAANDSGWFPGLVAMGATPEEMAAVRAAERFAQGITPEQEREAERALAEPAEFIGSVRVVRMAHSKCATVGDRLAIAAIAAGQPIPPYVVFSGDGEVNFSGPGDLAQALHQEFPGGWAGGSGLGDANGVAFWGGYPITAWWRTSSASGAEPKVFCRFFFKKNRCNSTDVCLS